MSGLFVLRAVAGLVALAAGCAPAAFAADAVALREDFAVPGRVEKGDIVFPGGLTYRRENNPNGAMEILPEGGLRLTVAKGLYEKALNGEGDLYDRSEMRESRSAYLAPQTEVWYRLGVRVPDGSPVTDTRLVVLQVKTPFAGYEDASPVVALRLENGQFFATAEHLLAPEEASALRPAVDGRCPDGMALGWRHDDGAPQFRALLATDGAGLPPRRRSQYDTCSPFLTVTRAAALPAAGTGWHDVVLGLKSGRAGWLVLVVNGIEVARAAGPLGDGNPKGQQYFKFGPYRDKSDETLSLDVRRFRRAATREALAE